jgi:hypothetical protein
MSIRQQIGQIEQLAGQSCCACTRGVFGSQVHLASEAGREFAQSDASPKGLAVHA